METAPQERSKSLHNFSLPCLKWGHQRLLRCVKVTDDHHLNHNRSSSLIPSGFQSQPTDLDNSKIQKATPIQENQTSSDVRFNGCARRLKVSPLLEEDGGNDDSLRPWNLRTRRAACKAPLQERRNDIDSPRRNLEIYSPRRNFENDSPRRKFETLLVKRQNVETVKDRVKFSVSLSKEEIEEDFVEMGRIRPPRRPKKRPRIVQKYLDSTFPGLWLTEVTPDLYKLPEFPES